MEAGRELDYIRGLATAFVRCEVSAVDLHRWLSVRRTPIANDLEADLWGLVFEIDDNQTDETSARRWLTDKYRLSPAA
jgi:hypothetical protein